jgi:hypothetical protein
MNREFRERLNRLLDALAPPTIIHVERTHNREELHADFEWVDAYLRQYERRRYRNKAKQRRE